MFDTPSVPVCKYPLHFSHLFRKVVEILARRKDVEHDVVTSEMSRHRDNTNK